MLKSAGTVTDSQTFNNPTFTGTVTASQVTGIEIVVAKWGVPCILASTGTMGNNGAVSAMTALPATFSGGAWLYLPAGAVAAGVPAAASFLWFVASSTTAGTVYNSSWDGTGIPPLGTTTAYSTTGPGAFTGIAAGEILCATVTIAAGAMGPNGRVLGDLSAAHNTAAGNKIFRVRHNGIGGTVILTHTGSTATVGGGQYAVRNLGVANAQTLDGFLTVPTASPGGFQAWGAVDTAAGATTIVYTLEKATATNHAILAGSAVKLVYGS